MHVSKRGFFGDVLEGEVLEGEVEGGEAGEGTDGDGGITFMRFR